MLRGPCAGAAAVLDGRLARRLPALPAVAATSRVPSAAGAAAQHLHQPRRHMGIMDRMKSMVENSRKDTLSKKKAEVFQWQLDALSAMDTFTMASHRALLEQTAEKMGLHDWRASLRTSAQQAEMEDQWVDLRVAQALRPEEVADPALLHRREKLRIAGELGVDVAKINTFLLNFEQTRSMHRWIAGRRRRGLPLPASLDEYQTAMVADRAGIDRDMQKLNAPRNRSASGSLKRVFK